MAYWLDDPNLISGGMLFGQLTGHLISDPTVADVIAAQGSQFCNRNTYLSAHNYAMGSPTDLSAAVSLLDGSGLGHMCVPNISALGELNFGTKDPGWPSGGLAKFLDGSMDTELARLCTVLNTLTRPFIFRLWREMDSTIAPWGANGSANGGVNETTARYIAAWQYVVSYIRARVPHARICWCPVLKVGDVLSDFTQWYPGDAWVDWNGADVYINYPTHNPLTTSMAAWHAAFNSATGTFSRKPALISETQVDENLSSRATDYATYTTVFGSGGVYQHGVYAIFFWNAGGTGQQYRIEDIPAGSLAAYQSMVNSDPFLGTPIERRYRLSVNRNNRLVVG